MAGLALSLAGFAGVIVFLQGGPNHLDRVNLWRLKAIVGDGVKLQLHPGDPARLSRRGQGDRRPPKVGLRLNALV